MLKSVCPSPSVIYDLGVENPLSKIMKALGCCFKDSVK